MSKMKVHNIVFHDSEDTNVFTIMKTFATLSDEEIFNIQGSGEFFVNEDEDGSFELSGQWESGHSRLRLESHGMSTAIYLRTGDYPYLRQKGMRQVAYKYLFSSVESFIRQVDQKHSKELAELNQ